MTVMWVTGAEVADPFVEVRECDRNAFSGSGEVRRFRASTKTYRKEDMCINSTGQIYAARYFLDPGAIHTAVATGLMSGVEYCYTVAGAHPARESAVARFKMPAFAEHSRDADEIRFLAWADSGTAGCSMFDGWCEEASQSTVDHMVKEARFHDFALHIGDISYAVGYAARWEQFFAEMMPLASQVPYMTAIGNHEYGTRTSFLS
jgi:acid phosphatase type 7